MHNLAHGHCPSTISLEVGGGGGVVAYVREIGTPSNIMQIFKVMSLTPRPSDGPINRDNRLISNYL